MRLSTLRSTILLCLAGSPILAAPFGIHVVDETTGRGVPLIELKTTASVSYWTDSGGWIAFDEPGLAGQEVYFAIAGDGYEYPADGFGLRGVRLKAEPGKEAEVRIKRLNVAERLYRITGEGIYRDSVLLEKEAPLKQPLINGLVVGQDSTQAVVWNDRVLWFWGDTGRVAYPLGHFGTAGATSELPSRGGLDPDRGVDLAYFVDASGFSRPTIPTPEQGMKWLDGLMMLPDASGTRRLVGRCAVMKSLGEMIDQRLMQWDDEAGRWQDLAAFDKDAPLAPVGHPIEVTVEGVRYFYFTAPYPNARVRADWAAIQDPAAYEGYTCLPPGSRWDEATATVERDRDGKVVWGWKSGTAAIDGAREGALIKRGELKPEERWLGLTDVETGRDVLLWGGSVAWNDYRKKYVMIANEGFGKPSFLGEVWFTEAPRPEGPWRRARRIVTHAKHSFYNPIHHTFFDQEGGRIIYFEGTYTDTFSDAQPTPRYNYNQVMYRLDLSDPRLVLE
ncbi:hypothetical protein GC173_04770 [bacterium]|nr:hypothetical protein [bacterium]